MTTKKTRHAFFRAGATLGNNDCKNYEDKNDSVISTLHYSTKRLHQAVQT